MKDNIKIRVFEAGDERDISALICETLQISNKKDYSDDFIKENVKSHSPEYILDEVKDAHFYVACDNERIIGCGGITGYWGSTTESYLLSIFVNPKYQGMGVGKAIVETLESDEFFARAWRTEVGSSLTAVNFYRKMGYQYKNGITDVDEYNVVRLEKVRDKS